jgi:nucleotide-binding universal stress UspA family protein
MYRITVGIDTEAASSAAVDWLTGWHRAARAQVTLVSAFDLLADDPDEVQAVLEREAWRVRRALPHAIVLTELADGAIPSVLERAGDVADLLVVGSHRTRHLRSVLTGRLSLRVAEHAACPVVVVPDDWKHRTGSIVVGLGDDDDASVAAVAFAAAEAADLGVPLRVLHAWQAPILAGDIAVVAPDPVGLRSAHGERLAEVARRARRRGAVVREHLHEGAPAFALSALGGDAALIVLGTHRTGPIGELLRGSTAATLVRDSRTPVCVVPAHWREPAETVPAELEDARG